VLIENKNVKPLTLSLMNKQKAINRLLEIVKKNYLLFNREELCVCHEPSAYANYAEPKIGTWIWHLDEHRIIWSDDLCRMLEIMHVTSGFEQWIGLLSPEDLAIFSSAIENIMRDHKTRNLVFRIKTKHKEKTINCCIECVVEPGTEDMIDIIGVCQDIGDNNVSGSPQFKDQLWKQEDINRKLLTIISHDLRTPFSSVLSLSGIMLQKYDALDKEKMEHYLKTILSCARNAQTMIAELTEWAQTHREDWNVVPQKFNCHELVLEVIKESKTAAESKDIELINDISPEYWIETDRNMLRIILRNLISNAIKFSFRNSEIIVSAKSRAAHYQFSVIDYGVGMEPQYAEQIFCSGVNSSITGTAGEKGLGIGLSICQELIGKLEGRIWVESKLGDGSSFHFEIPCEL
jgi:nitrogen fixation/metabolism regulation signal transduction histidine kinase